MPPGVANRARITSGAISTAPEQYELSWEVESFSPILEYKVAYRPVRVSEKWSDLIMMSSSPKYVEADEDYSHYSLIVRDDEW